MLFALAALAQTVGVAHRAESFQMIGAELSAEGRSAARTTPEHVNRVTEMMKQMLRRMDNGRDVTDQMQGRHVVNGRDVAAVPSTLSPPPPPLPRREVASGQRKINTSQKHNETFLRSHHALLQANSSREPTPRNAFSTQTSTNTNHVAAQLNAPVSPQRAKRFLDLADLENQQSNGKKTKISHDDTSPIQPLSYAEKVISLQRELSNKCKQLAQEKYEKAEMAAQIGELKRQLQESNTARIVGGEEVIRLRDIAEQQRTAAPLLPEGKDIAKLQLDLELAEMALAACSADADCWRAYQEGYRYLLDDHKRLSRLNLQAKRKNEEIRDLRYRLRVVERMYTELDSETWNVWNQTDCGEKVIRGDEGLKVSNAELRKENEKLKLDLEKLRGQN